MRDMDKIREKIEIRLDTRQVAFGVLGVLTTAAAVFSLGVYLGQRTAAPLDAPALTLAQLDARADMAACPPPAPLLARPPVPEERLPARRATMAEAAVGRVAPTPPPAAVAAASPAGRVALASPQGATPTSGSAGRVAPTPPPVAVAATASPARVVLAPPPAAAAAATGKTEDVAVPTRPAGPSAAAAPSGSGRSGGYTLQIKAFRDENEAKSFLEKVRTEGVDAYLTVSDLQNSGRWFRIRVGRFDDTRQAMAFQREFEAGHGYTTFISPR